MREQFKARMKSGASKPTTTTANDSLLQDKMRKTELAQRQAEQAAADYRAAQAAIDMTNPIYSNTKQPYMDIYSQLRKSLQNQRTTDIKNIESNRDSDLAKSNAGYDNTARQNYINYMQAQKRLPSELNALGIRGGASESSLIRLGTNYGTNVASNESARQGALNDIRKAYAQQISDYDKDLNNRLFEAEATARQNQLNWEREQQEKDLQYFSGAIEGLYGTTQAYDTLIAQLQASNDPNKEYKMMLALKAKQSLAEKLAQAAAKAAAKNAASSSGGGSSKSSKKSSSKKSSGKKKSGGGGGGGNSASVAAVNAAQTKGQSMTDYYKNLASSGGSSKSSSSGYRIHGESSKNWQ